MKALLGNISDFCYFHYRIIFILFLMTAVMLLSPISSLKVETDFLKLFPQHNTTVGAFTGVLQSFGSLDKLYLLVERREEMQTESFTAEADKLAQYLEKIEIDGHKAFADIQYKISSTNSLSDAKTMLSIFINNPLHFIAVDDIPRLKEKLSDSAMAYQLSKDRKALLSPSAYGLKDIIAIDPLDLRSLFEQRFKGQAGGFQFDLSTGYFLSPNKQSLLMIASPSLGANNMQFSRQLMQTIARYADAQKGIRITYTGANAVAVSNEAIIKNDMQKSVITSFVGVLLLLYIVYRRFSIILFMNLPIMMGILCTLAIASFTTGINILSSTFAAIVVGLGVDYPIHLYDRYHYERVQGRETREALRHTFEGTGMAVLIGALTTVFAFIALGCASIQAISQFGLLAATGMFSCLISTYLLFPSLLSWYDKRKVDRCYQPLRAFGLPYLSSFITKYRIPLITGILLYSLVMCFCSLQISFENNLINLRPREEPVFAVQEKINEQFGSRGDHLFVYTEGNDLNSLVSLEDRLVEILEQYKKSGEVLSFNSPALFLNSREKQEVLLSSLAQSINFQEVGRSFHNNLEKSGFNRAHFQPMEKLLNALQQQPQQLISSPDLLLERLRESPAARLINMYINIEGGNYKIITPFFVGRGGSISQALLDDIRQLGQNIKITGTVLVNREILSMVKQDLARCLAVAVLLIFACVYMYFRNIVLVMYAFVPICLGTLWMLGSMAILKVKIDAVNAVILPMIMGVGIDNGVHILQRYLENRSGKPEDAVSLTGRAISMAALTTVVSFGSLITCTYPALSIMGLSIMLGMIFCLFNSLITMPALLTFYHGQTKSPTGSCSE